MSGYAVVDLETTGLRPSWHDRIVEIGIVLLDPDGEQEVTWETLVNPQRDLGPQEVHGIAAADVLAAPTFADVAGPVADLRAELDRAGFGRADTPRVVDHRRARLHRLADLLDAADAGVDLVRPAGSAAAARGAGRPVPARVVDRAPR